MVESINCESVSPGVCVLRVCFLVCVCVSPEFLRFPAGQGGLALLGVPERGGEVEENGRKERGMKREREERGGVWRERRGNNDSGSQGEREGKEKRGRGDRKRDARESRKKR